MDDGEWWDVVDADGEATGEKFLRGAPGWPAGRFHLIVATCLVRDDGMVLLTQRASGKEFGYGWEFPGGSAIAGETSRVAARRELYEETGVAVAPEHFTLVGRFVEASALLDFYIAQATPHLELHLQASEVMAAAWATPSDVERRVDAQLMALPWIARLETLWPKTKAMISAAPIADRRTGLPTRLG